MYTHCPHCDTCFRITSEQLKIARGSVRCGRCFGTFSALEHLVDEPPHPQAVPPALSSAPRKKPAPPPKPTVKRERPAPIVTPKLTPALIPAEVPSAAVKARQTPAPAPASPTTTVTRLAPPQPTVISPVTTPPPESKAGPAPKTEVTPPPIIELEGSSAAPAPSVPASKEGSQELLTSPPPDAQQPVHKKVWLWALATPLLALLFVSQYAWFNLDSLSQKTSLRPALQTMCGLFSCDVPLIKSPQMVTLTERNIRNHPNRKQVLQVKARIISKAPYPQAFPLMELSLHDIMGKVLATRRFTPDEYLTPDIDQKQGMPSQQLIDIVLELDDPGKEAVGFEFAFF